MDDSNRPLTEEIQEQIKLLKTQIKLLSKDRARALIANSDDARFSEIETALASAEAELKQQKLRLKDLQTG